MHSTFIGSFLEYLPFYIAPHNVDTDYTGLEFTSAHLWFIQYLFIFSLVALPLFLFLKRRPGFFDWLAARCDKRGGILWLALPYLLLKIPIEIVSQARYAHIVLFIYGFLLMGSPRTRDAITRDRRIALVLGGLTMIGYFAPYMIWGVISFPKMSAGDILFFTDRTLNTWFWVVTILGYGQRYLNFTNQVQKYANEAVYPFYLVHQTAIVAIGYFVVQWNVKLWIKFTVLMLGALALTLLLYDACVRRWNVVSWRVAEELAARSAIASRAEVDYHAGGRLSLMERLVGYDRVILIDALHSDIDMMGSVRAFHLNDLGNLAAGHLSSSHDTTLKNAMEAAQAIGLKLPHDVRVVAIESPCVYDFATQLAPQVEAAVPRATQTVEEILGMWKQKNWT